MHIGFLALGLTVLAAPVWADEVVKEQTTLGKSAITLYLQPFLDETELKTLRLVSTNEQALALFVPSDKGYSALAAAPKDGFIKDGQPVASAIALSDLPDAESAAKNALEACNAAKKSKDDCVILLEIGPKP